MPKQCSEGIDETTSDLIKLFTLRDAADPGFKVLVPEGHKPRNSIKTHISAGSRQCCAYMYRCLLHTYIYICMHQADLLTRAHARYIYVERDMYTYINI